MPLQRMSADILSALEVCLLKARTIPVRAIKLGAN